MKHLEKYEDFGYHSELDEDKERSMQDKREDEKFNPRRIDNKKKADPEMSKCFKCNKNTRLKDTSVLGKSKGIAIVPGFG